MIQSLKKDNLTVKIYTSREGLGRAAGNEAANQIKALQLTQLDKPSAGLLKLNTI